MAHSLGISTIADGIETDEQWQFLKNKACDFAQGYLFSKPLTKDEFLIYVRDYYRKAG
jgi:sensor c-di-GMP phosphodiesterase-like protein